MIHKKLKDFLNENTNVDDMELTNYRNSINGYGEVDTNKTYSFNNSSDVDEIFDIIESVLFFQLVSRNMNKRENNIDEELNKDIEKKLNLLDEMGAYFGNGIINLNGASKIEIIKKFMQLK